MWLRRDERGQSVQVGAALLLGFLVVATTLYQAQVVPAQNAEIEFDHSQQVQGELQELRNAVADAGSSETTQSRSIRLGTRYPARTVFVNPPPARGVLRTEDAGAVSLSNAEVSPDAPYGEDADDLLASAHPTSRIVYEPRYNEYGDTPTTVVEHATAYNRYADNTTGALSSQPVVRGSRLRLTLLAGELEEQGADTVSVEARTVSGPTDPVPIVPADDTGPIELRFGVLAPQPWNRSIGTAYDEGQTDARVASYDAASGQLTVELAGDRYELRVALVGVGEETRETDRYDVSAEGGAGAYDVAWQNDSATVPAGTASETFTAVTSPDGVTGADVDFSLRDPDGVGATAGDATDDRIVDGSADFEVENLQNPGTVELFVASGGSGDSMTVTVEGGVRVGITGTNSPVQEGEQLNVSASVENTGDTTETQTVELAIDGTVVDSTSVSLAPGATRSLTLTWGTGTGDAGEYQATVSSADDSDATNVQVTSGPTFTSLNASVTNERGGTEASEVTFEYNVSEAPPSATFEAVDANGNGDAVNVTSNFGDPVVVSWGGGGSPQDNYPVEVTADLENGDCRVATLQSGDDTAALDTGEWSAC